MNTTDHGDPFDVNLADLREVLDRVGGSAGPRVVAVVVTWNSGDHIGDCLDSIRRSALPVATLVVDNASSDGTAAIVEQRGDPDVVLIQTGANLGYAGGNNLGLGLADTAGAGFAVIVNPDATLDPN